jgi:hypothetical protein
MSRYAREISRPHCGHSPRTALGSLISRSVGFVSAYKLDDSKSLSDV